MDRRTRGFLIAGLIITALMAGVISTVASDAPDGLEKVAADEGLADTAGDHALDGSPLADYSVTGVGDERIGTGLAGIIGAAVALVAMVGLLYGARAMAARRRRAAGG